MILFLHELCKAVWKVVDCFLTDSFCEPCERMAIGFLNWQPEPFEGMTIFFELVHDLKDLCSWNRLNGLSFVISFERMVNGLITNGSLLATFSSERLQFFTFRCMSSLELFLLLFILVLHKTFGSLVLFCSKHIWLLNACMLNWYHLNISAIWNNMPDDDYTGIFLRLEYSFRFQTFAPVLVSKQ